MSARHSFRKGRVHVTYDAEFLGGTAHDELPFTVGILADLSADGAKALPRLAQREFVDIDRQNFDAVVAAAGCELRFQVADCLTNDPNKLLDIHLKVRSLNDLRPAAVAAQVEPLRELRAARQKLGEILGKIESNARLEGQLTDILDDAAQRTALDAELRPRAA